MQFTPPAINMVYRMMQWFTVILINSTNLTRSQWPHGAPFWKQCQTRSFGYCDSQHLVRNMYMSGSNEIMDYQKIESFFQLWRQKRNMFEEDKLLTSVWILHYVSYFYGKITYLPFSYYSSGLRCFSDIFGQNSFYW